MALWVSNSEIMIKIISFKTYVVSKYVGSCRSSITNDTISISIIVTIRFRNFLYWIHITEEFSKNLVHAFNKTKKSLKNVFKAMIILKYLFFLQDWIWKKTKFRLKSKWRQRPVFCHQDWSAWLKGSIISEVVFRAIQGFVCRK